MKRHGLPKFAIISISTICIAAAAVAAYKICSILRTYRAADDEYAKLQDLVGDDLAEPSADASSQPDAARQGGAVPSAATPDPTAQWTADASAAAEQEPSVATARPVAASPESGSKDGAQPGQAVAAAGTAGQEGSAAPTGNEQTGRVVAPTGTAGQEEPTSTTEITQARQSAAATGTAKQEKIKLTPSALSPVPLVQIDFAPLLKINDDTVGWIRCEDSSIDYPIVLGDDNIFYLKHLFSGAWGFSGTIFMDMDNMGDFSDQNTVAYGHHMNNGTMFAGLSDFVDQAYFDAHPTMTLYTPAGDYTVELFAAYNRDASAIPHDFDTPEDFLAYVAELQKLSLVTADVEIAAGDRLLTLSTCSYVYDDARFVLIGKLIPLYRQ